jgi:hypothetical protein
MMNYTNFYISYFLQQANRVKKPYSPDQTTFYFILTFHDTC